MRLKAIVPKRLILSKSILKEVTAAVNSSLDVMQRDFARTTKSWDHKVTFEVNKAAMSGRSLEGSVGTDDDVFNWVDKGTRPHEIYPIAAEVLRFQGGYQSKTTPGVIGSHQGGSSGMFIYAESVHHPGIAARNFTDEIARRRRGMLESRISAAILKATGG